MRTSYFADYVQRLPLAVFRTMDVVVNGSDNEWARAYLAEQAFLAGKPFVDAGFRGERLQVGVFVPGSPAADPCWRCLHPDIVPDARFSCEEYATRAERQGLVPAVQAVAQAAGAIQAEHAILALHGQFPLRNSVFHLNLRTGEAMKYAVARDRHCPSPWHRVGGMRPLLVACGDGTTWGQLLDEVAVTVGEDVCLKPLVDLVWNMPCRDCKHPMAVRTSAWLYNAAPRCVRCGGPFALLPPAEAAVATAEYYAFIDRTRVDTLGRALAQFGIYAGDLLIAEGVCSAKQHLVQLNGAIKRVAKQFAISTSTTAGNSASTARHRKVRHPAGQVAGGDRQVDADMRKEPTWT